MANVGFDPAQFAKLEKILSDFATNETAGLVFEKTAPILDKDASDRFNQIADGTPFSKFSYGRKRPSGNIITQSSRFAIDTGAFFRDWTKTAQFMGLQAVRSTELAYVENLQALFEFKSPFPDGLLGYSDMAQDQTLDGIAQEYETLWKS
jgi:hypothetical protein